MNNSINNTSNSLMVHKFGGSSLASAAHFQKILAIVTAANTAIVVSAAAGTTNQLQQCLDLAKTYDTYLDVLAAIENNHKTIITQLHLNAANQTDLLTQLQHDCEKIKNLLQTTQLLGSYNKDLQDRILSYGEIWSATILHALFAEHRKSLLIDASQILVTYNKNNQLHIDWDYSKELLYKKIADQKFAHLIITGFIARNRPGQIITLGRNGSDYSAAIFAKILDATQLIIWTDVDGIYSADPNKVRSAFALPHLSYEEALELAYFGATVIHPHTIFPAIAKNIPIIIKNSANPDGKGTLISGEKSTNDFLIKGLSAIEDIALINIEGAGMTGVSGIAARVFEVLHQQNISVILISQASSEHSICFAVNKKQAEPAITALNEQFHFEIEQQAIKRIVADTHCAILAVVGDGMVGKRGIAGRLCDTLAKANVNIQAIAQGSSERNVSLVLQQADIHRAMRAVHAGFYLSRKTISIGIIGPGQVGKTLLQQINASFIELQKKHHVNLYVRGIMDSKKMQLTNQQFDLNEWQNESIYPSQKSNIDLFIQHIAAEDMPHAVIIDCTASQHVADHYQKFIQHGLHIVTPNKKANSGNLQFYHDLQKLAQDKNRFYLYETTVCAGLPVIKTLQDIIATGDEVLRIQGVVSGTLSYIFNQLRQGDTFSTIIRQAKTAGYTEPDPRDDLSGMDVARKFACLARELGHSVDLDDIEVTNLVPPALREVSVEEFLNRLPEFDAELQSQLNPILEKQQNPCYVGTIAADGKIEIAIQGFDSDHPLSRLNGTDNMLIFNTRRYCKQPLVIQGPGAGTEVTAAGIFADLLRLVTALN